MDTLLRDIRLAVRRLRLSPGFTLFAVVSLALGVGVSTAVYSAVRTFFWMPLGIPEAAQLVTLTSGQQQAYLSWLDYQDLQSQQTVFRLAGVSAPIRTAFVSNTRAEVILGDAVSGGYFGVTGVAPRYGRLIAPSDERDGVRAPGLVRARQFHNFATPNAQGTPKRPMAENAKQEEAASLPVWTFWTLGVGR